MFFTIISQVGGRTKIELYCYFPKSNLRIAYFFTDKFSFPFLHPLIRTLIETMLEFAIKRALRNTTQTGKLFYCSNFSIIFYNKVLKLFSNPGNTGEKTG